MNDLRRTDFYLTTDEQCKWDNRNILYNNIWFYINKKGMPDIEYSDAAISIFQSQKKFQNWKVLYHPYGGKIISPPNSEPFNADIMTGWWNPTKYFLKLENRNKISEDLLNDIPPQKERLLEWVQSKNSSINERQFNSFVNFLENIYTAGNLIPAPFNWKSGSSLDGWDYKLYKIINNKENKQGALWYEYIKKHYKSLKEFVTQNNIQMYFDKNKQVISFWKDDKPTSWSEATTEQWATYFKTASECIIARNNSFIKNG